MSRAASFHFSKRIGVVIFIFILITAASVFCNYYCSTPRTSKLGMPNFRIASSELSGSATNAALSAAYDEQIGMTFTQSFRIIWDIPQLLTCDGPDDLLDGCRIELQCFKCYIFIVGKVDHKFKHIRNSDIELMIVLEINRGC